MCLERLIYHNNPLSRACIAAVEYAMSRERTQAAKLLDDMEDARLERKQDMKERELARKIKAAADEGGEELRDKKTAEVLEPGVKIWIPVSFGRNNNVLGKIEVDSATTLMDARININKWGDLGDEWVFLSVNDGQEIGEGEEGKRQIIWDCGRQVLLRPKNWIEL